MAQTRPATSAARSIFTAAAMLALSGTAFGAPLDGATESRRTPTHCGTVMLELADPDARACDAQVPGMETWTAHNRVIVRASSRGTVQKAAPDAIVRAVDGLPNYWVVEAASVGAAIDLANTMTDRPGVQDCVLDIDQRMSTRSIPTDPELNQQWHLINTLEESNPLFDVNIEGAWNAGYTGAGQLVGVVDDGYRIDHPDLAPNHEPIATQTRSTADSNHGTAVAGIVGAVGNNGLGGVGVAYGADLGRLYFFGGPSNVTDTLLFRNDIIDIKTNSWGPTDDGVLDFITDMEKDALESAATTARFGRGMPIIWAGGNGRLFNDRVDYDPFASSRYSVAVGAISAADTVSQYSEPGASLLVCSQSDESLLTSSDIGIFSTSDSSLYTSTFGGTSAAAPIVAGVVALMLEANPCLTWRDVQHILVNTARKNDPGSEGWSLNGAGHDINEDYGFGAVDASLAVLASESWLTVNPNVPITEERSVNQPIVDGVEVQRSIAIDGGSLVVETVEVDLTIVHNRMGDLNITLTSPSGVVSRFMAPRADGTPGFVDYRFTSVRHWDEPADGAWTLTVLDDQAGNTGDWIDWTLTVQARDATPRVAACDLTTPYGTVDVLDLLQHVDWFLSNDQRADQQCDEDVDISDLLAFLECFFVN